MMDYNKGDIKKSVINQKRRVESSRVHYHIKFLFNLRKVGYLSKFWGLKTSQ